MYMDELLPWVLGKIRPSKEEEEQIKRFINNLVRVGKTVSGLDCVICGSIGKFTWLRGDHDIDLFMLFPKTVPREELERRGLAFGKKIVAEMNGSFVIKYAEHPYVHAQLSGYDVDIVPCYRISKEEKIISAVDRSPLHLEYVLSNLDENKRDEVRLLKQFCKAVGVYGSDARQQGFSGYLCELLILKYGSFSKVIKDAAKWGAPKVVGIGNIKLFSNQPLVIIDPVDSKRNVAANMNSENFIKFVTAARRFVAKSEEKYFFKEKQKPLSDDELKNLVNRGTYFSAIVMEKPDLVDDVLYPQMRKALDRLVTELKHNEFVILKHLEYGNSHVVLFFEFEVWTLPKTKKMIGPTIFSKQHGKEFRSKYKNEFISVEDVYWVAEKEREFRSASQLLKSILAKSAEEMKRIGIPDNIAKPMQRARLLEGKDFWDFVQENSGFSIFLREKYFSKLN